MNKKKKDRLKTFVIVEIIFFSLAAPFVLGMDSFRTRTPCETHDTILQGQVITTHPPIRDTYSVEIKGNFFNYSITKHGESSFYAYLSWDGEHIALSEKLDPLYEDWFTTEIDINGIVDICIIKN